MGMTQERAGKIAYSIILNEAVQLCIRDNIAAEDLIDIGDGSVAEITANYAQIGIDEAKEFDKLFLEDIKGAIAKMEESRARAEQGVYS